MEIKAYSKKRSFYLIESSYINQWIKLKYMSRKMRKQIPQNLIFNCSLCRKSNLTHIEDFYLLPIDDEQTYAFLKYFKFYNKVVYSPFDKKYTKPKSGNKEELYKTQQPTGGK